MGSGKSTIANYLCDTYGYTKFSLGEKIHSECELYNKHDRTHLQQYGQMMRQLFSETIWCDYVVNKSKGIDKIIIDDGRQLNEYDYFTNLEYLPIGVFVNKERRIERLKNRVNYEIDPETFEHETEKQARDCVKKCKIKICNNWDETELINQIDKIMMSIYID